MPDKWSTALLRSCIKTLENLYCTYNSHAWENKACFSFSILKGVGLANVPVVLLFFKNRIFELLITDYLFWSAIKILYSALLSQKVRILVNNGLSSKRHLLNIIISAALNIKAWNCPPSLHSFGSLEPTLTLGNQSSPTVCMGFRVLASPSVL